MEIINLSIPDLKLIRLKPIQDERGFFKEFYRQDLYKANGIGDLFSQDNFSFSKQGVLRGMHFQSFPGQAKLVSVIQGKIFDVAVDIRTNSPTFGKWEGVYLDANSHEQFFIPSGFAHGFYVIEDALVHYKVSSLYNPSTEKTFRFDDPAFAIQWPTTTPILSLRDQSAPLFAAGASI